MYQRRVGGYSLLLSLQPHPGALYRFSQTVNPRQQHSKYCQLADKARKMKEKLKKNYWTPKEQKTQSRQMVTKVQSLNLGKRAVKGIIPITQADGGLQMPRESWRQLIPGQSLRFTWVLSRTQLQSQNSGTINKNRRPALLLLVGTRVDSLDPELQPKVSTSMVAESPAYLLWYRG